VSLKLGLGWLKLLFLMTMMMMMIFMHSPPWRRHYATICDVKNSEKQQLL